MSNEATVGAILREAREKKGLSTSEVALATRMKVQIVEEIEHDDFSRIAAPIYAKGFIKLYAECVGVDPMPLRFTVPEDFSLEERFAGAC